MLTRRSRRLGFASLALTALALTGCGSDGPTASPIAMTTTTPTTQPSTTPTTTPTTSPTTTPTTTPTTSPTTTPTTTPTTSPTTTPTTTPNPQPTVAMQTGQSCPGLGFNTATNRFEATLQYSAAGQQCGGVGAYHFQDGNGTLEPATVTHTSYDSTRVAIYPGLTGTTRTNTDPGTYFAYKSLATGNSTISLVFQVSNSDGTMSTYNGLITIQTNY